MADNTRKVVLTTGANSGLGLATAIEVARRGYTSVGSVRSDQKADVLAKAAADAGVQVQSVILDVTDGDACTETMAAVGPLYGLVNNAGYGLEGAVEDVDDDEARALFETMVLAPVRLARLALPGMRVNGGGRIVNISSIAGRTAVPLAGWYHAVKHALEALSDSMRVEVAGSGVKVVLVEPGGFKTNIWDDVEGDTAKRDASAYAGAYRRSLAMVRFQQRFMGEPQQVASVIGRVLDTPFPRSRYLVGLDAQGAALADALTPTVVKDRLFRFTLGL